MAAPSTIRILLADGLPGGLRILEKSNWTGRAFDFPRASWPEVRLRQEFGRPGVYVLTGIDDEGEHAVYVGEADALRARLNQQFVNIDFWSRAIAFVSTDENLNKADVRYLEARLVERARAARRSVVRNTNSPARPFLSEADEAEVSGFFEEMLLIYEVAGISSFTIPKLPEPGSAKPGIRLSIASRGFVAYGRESPDGMIVEAGSFASRTEAPSIRAFVRKARMDLQVKGVLVPKEGNLMFAQPWAFSSPTTAAGVIVGRSINGRTAWKDDNGRSLRQLQELAANSRE